MAESEFLNSEGVKKMTFQVRGTISNILGSKNVTTTLTTGNGITTATTSGIGTGNGGTTKPPKA